MTLNDLRYLVTLARERHFGRAAEACFVSQPTLSIAIKKLEEELGVMLFERHRHEVLVTPAGEGIIRQAERVLEEADTLKGMAQAARDEFQAPLRLGAIFTVGPYLFPGLVRKLKTACPDLLLYLEENYTHVLAEKLARGELDIILVALPFDQPEIQVTPLFDEDFHLLLPANHDWAKRKIVPTGELDQVKLLLLGEGHCFRDQILEACPSVRAPQNGASPGSSLETLRHMVASGLGLTLIPACSEPYLVDDGLATLPLAPPASRRIVAVWRRRFPRPRAIRALVDTLQALNLPGTRKPT